MSRPTDLLLSRNLAIMPDQFGKGRVDLRHQIRGVIVKLKSALVCLLIALLSVSPVYGQTYRGSVRGSITDASRTHLAGVVMKLASEETNEVREATSAEDGEFAISLLPPGSALPGCMAIPGTGQRKAT